ncbi:MULTISPECIES: hypothetical protein [Pantoea]|uniref:hypothetical protein n=1 Tax=Pantoea TaxID=53335 RepID=UPI00197D8152|nr:MULTISPECIES: hypothetical protein [Pantoea]
MAILDRDERTITHHFITIGTAYRTRGDNAETGIATIKPMRELVSYLHTQLDFTAGYVNDTIEVTLQDIKYYPIEPGDFKMVINDRGEEEEKYDLSIIDTSQKTHVCFLINFLFKGASKSVLRDKKSGDRTIFGPSTPSQGFEVSSHILLNLNENNGKHDATIERIPKIPTAIIQGFLNKALLKITDVFRTEFEKKHSFGATDDSDEEVRKIRYRCKFDIDGKIDPDFLNQVNNGVINDVIIARDSTSIINLPDVNQPIIPIEENLRLSTKNIQGGALTWLKAACNFYKDKNYTRVKVKYTAPSGISATANMKIDMIRAEGIENKIIMKSILKGFTTSLNDSYTLVQDDIMQKMLEEI